MTRECAVLLVVLASCGPKPTPTPVVTPLPIVASAPVDAARRRSPPVAPSTTIPCKQLIDAAAFTKALGEAAPLAIHDDTKREPEAAASCALVRGGQRPSEAEQQAILKQQGRLSALPGDTLCQVTAYCWTIEDLDHFKSRCASRHDRDDSSMGSYACLQVVPAGAYDFNVYRFLDRNGCVMQVRGGPANIDQAQILACAKAARDLIGPAQIAPP